MTDPKTVVSVTSPREIVEAIPKMLGYTPVDSIVAIPFCGSRSRGVLRTDFPADGTPAPLAVTLAAILHKIPGFDSVILAYFTNQSASTLTGLADSLPKVLSLAGVVVNASLFRAQDGWGETDSLSSPHPLSDLAKDPALHSGQRSGTELPTAAPTLKAATATVLANTACLADSTHAARILARSLDDLDATELAILADSFRVPAERDVTLATWLFGDTGGHRYRKAQDSWQTKGEYPLSDIFLLGQGPTPDPTRLKSALQTARYVAAHTSDDYRAAALAVCSWCAWGLGNGTHAAIYAAEAITIAGDHGLANLVHTLADAGQLPAWIYSA